MTSEGVFPKVHGDVVYASETNMFYPKFIGFRQAQDTGINTSGADVFIPIGSIYYDASGANILRSYMNVRATVDLQGGATSAAGWAKVRISGGGINLSTGSSYNNGQLAYTLYLDKVFTSGAITASGGNITSPMYIYVDAFYNFNAANTFLGDMVVVGY